MQLVIISPYYKQEHAIIWLDIITPYGNFIIQEGHAPMIIDLSPDQPFSFALENGVQKSIQVQKAVLTVARKKATLIMNEPEDG